MKPFVKAISTEYNGLYFRSRLEARWAVFFDHAKIKYEYEPEGFEHDGVKYLPDFYLPDFDVYAEVKPDREGIEKDIIKCRKSIYWGGPIKAIIFLGNIPGPCKEGGWNFPVLYYDASQNLYNDHISAGWWSFFNGIIINDDLTVSAENSTKGCIVHAVYLSPLNFSESGKHVGGMVKSGKFTNVSLRPRSDKELGNSCCKGKSDTELQDIEEYENPYLHKAFKAARTARFEFQRK